jgi:Zn-dependent protease
VQQFDLYTFLSQATVLLFAVIFHECAHGYIAEKLGDPTARLSGRITLNPIPHIDPFGTILLPILTLLSPGNFFFGYAKPVPVTTTNLRRPRWDSIWVALAGPASNFLLAFLAAVTLAFVRPGGDQSFSTFIHPFLVTALVVNVVLGVFNLIPVPPLDGSWILMGLLPLNWAIRFAQLRPYGMLILIALMVTRLINVLMWPAGLLIGAFSAIASL